MPVKPFSTTVEGEGENERESQGNNTEQFVEAEELVEQQRLSPSADNTLIGQFLSGTLPKSAKEKLDTVVGFEKNSKRAPRSLEVESGDLSSIHSSDWNPAIDNGGRHMAESGPIESVSSLSRSPNIQGSQSDAPAAFSAAPLMSANNIHQRPTLVAPFFPPIQQPSPIYAASSGQFGQTQPLRPFNAYHFAPQSFQRPPGVENALVQNLAMQLRALISQLDQDQALLKTKEAELAAEYERKKADLNADRTKEQERLNAAWQELENQQDKFRKARSFFEKQKSMVEKDESAKIKLLKGEILNQQEEILDRERQLSDQRAKLRELEQKFKELEKVNLSVKAENDRVSRRNRELDDSVAKMRSKAAHLALTVKAQSGPAKKQKEAIDTGTPEVLRRIQKEKEPRSAPQQPKAVRFALPAADDKKSTSLPNSPSLDVAATPSTDSNTALDRHFSAPLLVEKDTSSLFDGMKILRRDTDEETGAVRTLYADASSWTRHWLMADKCNKYEYSNGDVKWLHKDNLLKVNHFANGGMTSIDVGQRPNMTKINYFSVDENGSQLDIFHADSSVSNYSPRGVRLETFANHTVERYTPDGVCSRRYLKENDRMETFEFGAQSASRPDGSWVNTLSDGSTEFCSNNVLLRRWQNGDVKAKFPLTDVEVTLLVDSSGWIKHLLSSGNKSVCCHWTHSSS